MAGCFGGGGGGAGCFGGGRRRRRRSARNSLQQRPSGPAAKPDRPAAKPGRERRKPVRKKTYFPSVLGWDSTSGPSSAFSCPCSPLSSREDPFSAVSAN